MAVTVKHLNGDASFLLSLEPVPSTPSPGSHRRPFRILLDPWISGPSTIFHSKISISTHKEQPCISSLADIPVPDIVIISQSKSDHCNEATLRQLPRSGTKTIILAEPASAKLIRSWKYFEPSMVRTIPRWEDPEGSGRETTIKIPVAPLRTGGDFGEVTVAFVPQKRDVSGLHGAIGITYRPPTTRVGSGGSPKKEALCSVTQAMPWTPPATPKSHRSFSNLSARFRGSSAPEAPPPLPGSDQPVTSPRRPTTPKLRLRSVKSATSLPKTSSAARQLGSTMANGKDNSNGRLPSPPRSGRCLSLLFAPHGISYPSLHPYVVSHLMPLGALPLTALLHCFYAVDNPWWLGGNILLGAPAGAEVANCLGARVWISAHDGEKDTKGVMTGRGKTRKWSMDEIEESVSPRSQVHRDAGAGFHRSPSYSDSIGSGRSTYEQRVEVLALASGEEIVLTDEGVWSAAVAAAAG